MADSGDHADITTLSGGRGVVLTVRFLTELALLAVLAVAGARASGGVAQRGALAVVAPVVAAVVWGAFLAPRARRRLADPLRLGVEIVVFGVAAAVLALTGPVLVAIVFAVVAIGVAVLVRLVTPGS